MVNNTKTDKATGVHLPKFTDISKFVTETKNGQIRTYEIVKPENYKID